ncbi:hypothetical protein HHI36_006606 [Cryptolaemus montrouzieri]|uniref:Uncharacterized protein n=1 Tax=Cryptolaemus montrouzieri TaxID=559131 RepID=A0ABD2NXM5_9CUCU
MLPLPSFFVSAIVHTSILCFSISNITSWFFVFHDVVFQHASRMTFFFFFAFVQNVIMPIPLLSIVYCTLTLTSSVWWVLVCVRTLFEFLCSLCQR